MKPAQTVSMADETPAVSVVVAVQDQAAELARLCTSLAAIDEDPHWELIVVDRGSFDATAELLRHITGDIVSVRTSRALHPAHALYRGLMRARGDIVAIVDADLLPDAGLIRALCHGAARRPSSDVFAGRVLDENGRTAIESGGPARLLAMRRRILDADKSRSAAHLAVRLRCARAARIIDFCARRVPLVPVGLTPEPLDHAAQSQPHAILAEHRQGIK
jgi:glycosyltransferase involved in cell wall biosynthesis